LKMLVKGLRLYQVKGSVEHAGKRSTQKDHVYHHSRDIIDTQSQFQLNLSGSYWMMEF
jgi:hypothetical protein